MRKNVPKMLLLPTMATLVLSLPLMLMAVEAEAAQSLNGLHCQRITAAACQGLGYNMTAMPNLAGHSNQLDAELRMAKLLPLIESGCSNRARFLLCSSLFPLCTPDVPRPVTACKSLCETVHAECAAHDELMHLWPEFLSCDLLPQPEKHELCMQIPQESLKQYEQRTAPVEQQESESSPHPLQQNHLHHQQQQLQNHQQQLQNHQQLQHHQQQLQHHQQHLQPQQFSWPWTAWKLPAHLSGRPAGPTVLCPQNFTASPLLLDECLPQCNRDAFHTTQQKKVAEGLILGLSGVCFVLTLFALVTFWAEPTRFGYPERPVLFLCLCYNLFSVCYLERIVFHNSARAHAALEDPFGKGGLPCALTPPCLASYITTSYLSLCAATWWLIFALCFFLSSHKKWSSEALEKKSGLFHVLAWVPPLAPPIAALLLERVRPNELTGMCSAPGFVEIPALVLLLVGLFFTLRASHSLHALQRQMQLTLGHQRFSQIRKRFLVFSLLFFLPTAAGVAAAFFERHVDVVPACSAPEDCEGPTRATPWPTLVRLFFQLAGGTLTGMWVWSRKTCESYRNRLVATPTSSSSANAASKAASAALPKKHLQAPGHVKSAGGPLLYSGINFHNIPAYNPHQSRV